MAHNISGCLHQTVPQRILQASTRKSGKVLQKQWVSASLLSSSQSDCFKHISALRTHHTARNPCRDQLAATRHQQLQRPPACCAQQQSGSYDNSFHALPQEPQEQVQGTKQAQVPWGMKEFVSVTLLWLFAFWCLGYFVLPGTMNLVGLDKDDLSIANQAIYHVVFDLCQLGLTIRILFQQLKAFRPRRLGWFNIQFLPLKQWLTPVVVAALSFPILDWAARVAQTWFPDDLWTQNLEQSIVRGDPTSNVLYFAVLILCAPIWEEAMFRGFMLPSLNKYMPQAAALLLTSAVFAMLHFSVQRFIPLVLLGVVLGVVYMRTRNLVAPIALHSLWNMYIFYNLLVRGSGVLG